MKSNALRVGVGKHIGFLRSFVVLSIPFAVCDFEAAR